MRYWKPLLPPTLPDTVGIVVAAYLSPGDERLAAAARCLIESLRAQTWPKWRAVVVHDGPVHPSQQAAWERLAEDPHHRVRLHVTADRRGEYGHPHRQKALRLVPAECNWIVHTNQDNYFVPTFLETMLSACLRSGALWSYCDMVHSHRLWKFLPCQVRRGRIDLSCVLVRRELAERCEFPTSGFTGDWTWISRLDAAAKGRREHVPSALVVHN